MQNQINNKKIAIVIKKEKSGNDGVLTLHEELNKRGYICDFIYSANYHEDNQYDDFLKILLDYDLIYFRVLSNKNTFAQRLLKEDDLKNKIILNKKYLEEPLLISKTFQMNLVKNMGINIPRFIKILFKDLDIDKIIKFTNLPAIVKASRGICGKKVFLISSKEDLARIEKDNVENEYLVQEFIPYEKDLRVFVINNKIWGVMERVPSDGHFKANISQGGFGTKLEDQKIYSKIEAIIDKISPKFNVEIAGYDFLIKGDEIYFLEINSNPGYKGLNVALNVETQAAIADYMDSLLN